MSEPLLVSADTPSPNVSLEPTISPGLKNHAETDVRFGEIRMKTLIPYACARLGQSLPVGFEPPADPTVRLSLRHDMAALKRKLALGADKIRELVNLTCERGVENMRPGDFLKRAQGGGKGKCKLPRAISDPLTAAIHEVCVVQGLVPGSKAANKAIRVEALARGAPRMPSAKTVRAIVKTDAIIRAHMSAVLGEHMCRIVDLATEALRPNQTVLLDGTQHSSESAPAECLYALDDFDRVLGLVNVIYGLDAATRGIWTALGFVGAANAFLAGLAIHRGLLAKDALLAEFGITGYYPWCGKPAAIGTDRGTEFVSEQLRQILRSQGIGFWDRSPPHTPHYHAKNERFHGAAHTFLSDFLRSDVGKKYLLPVPGKPQANGIRFKYINPALFDWLVNSYHNRGHGGLGGDTPLQRFLDMAQGKRGFTASGLPKPVADRDDLMWDFLWKVPRVINHVGIAIDNRHYNAKILTSFLAAGKRSSIKRQSVGFNPYLLGEVFVREGPDGRIFRIPYQPKNDLLPMTGEERAHTLNCSLWEWRAAVADLKRTGEHRPTEERVAQVLESREQKLLNPKARTSGVLTQRDAANHEMRVSFSSAQPGAVAARPDVTVVLPSRCATPTLLPIGDGGADEY